MTRNPFEQYENIQIKRMQVVYLSAHLKMAKKKVAEITGYAISTVKTYTRKFIDLLSAAKEYFEKPIALVIQILCDDLGKAKNEKCYLFKFYDNSDKLLFSKVGTTTRAVKTRLKEEIKTYRKSGFDIGKAEICKVIDCGNVPAEGAESFCRAAFIKQFPHTFKKNDRFMNVDIPTAEFTKIVKGYLAQPFHKNFFKNLLTNPLRYVIIKTLKERC